MAIAPIDILFRGINQANSTIKAVARDVAGFGLAFDGVTAAVNTMKFAYGKFYNDFIQSNVVLQNQLLATQASLVATTKVISNGLEIKDPLKAIKALEQPVLNAIASIREKTFDLVGVTSADIIPLFQIAAQESAGIGATLQQSADLAVTFAASLGTLKIPLYQARQEMVSIFQGMITMDSALAKNLGITNEMVNRWKAQGQLVEKLQERMAAFVEGNKQQALTIEGVTSNIRDIYQEVTRVGGEALIVPIVVQLDKVYQWMSRNRREIEGVVKIVTDFFLTVAQKIGDILQRFSPVWDTLVATGKDALEALGKLVASVVTSMLAAFQALTPVLVPVINSILSIIAALAEFANSPVGQFILQSIIYFTLLSNTIVVAQVAFATLSTVIGTFGLGLGLSNLGLARFLIILGQTVPALAPVTSYITGVFIPSMIAAGGGVMGFGAALAGLAASALVAAAPLIAISLILAKVYASVEEDKLEAIDQYGKNLEAMSESALRTAGSLKQLNDAEKATGKLTEEESKRRDKLRRQAQIQIESYQDYLKILKEFQQSNPNDSTKAQIAETERYIKMLARQSGETRTTARNIEELGNSYQQLGRQAEDALTKLNYDGKSKAPAGIQADYQRAAGDLLKTTSKAYEMGMLTAGNVDELGKTSAQIAIARFEKLRDDARLMVDQQLQAHQEIEKVRQAELDKQVKASEIQQSKIQELISGEVYSQSEGQRMITREKIKQLDLQNDATKKSIEAEQVFRKKLLDSGGSEIKKQITAKQDELKVLEAKGNDDKLTEQERQQKLSLQSQINYLTQLDQQNNFIEKINKESDEKTTERNRLRERRFAGVATADDKAKERMLTAQIDILEGQKDAAKKGLEADNKLIIEKKAALEKGLAERKSVELENIRSTRQERLKDYDEQTAQVKASYDRWLLTQEEFNTKSRDLAIAKAKEELAQLAERKKNARGKEAIEEITTREAELRTQIKVVDEKYYADRYKIKQQYNDYETKQLESQYSQFKVTQQEYNKQSLDLAKSRAESELSEVARIRKQKRKDDTLAQAELDSREAAARANLFAATEKFNSGQYQIQQKYNESDLKQLEAKNAEGLITEKQFNEESFKLARQKSEFEIAEVERLRKLKRRDDTLALEELAAREAEARSRLVAAQERYRQDQVAQIELTQRESLQKVKDSEVDRLKIISQLESDLTIRKEEAAVQRGEVARKQALAELELERDKLRQLEALQPIDNERKERERQLQLAQLRTSITQKTKALIDDEIQQRQRLFHVVEEQYRREQLARQNIATQTQQEAKSQIQLQDFMKQSLQQQNTLLQARKDLISSTESYITSQLNILKETTQNKNEQKIITEAEAQIRLNTVREQFNIERQLLDLKIQQRDLALESQKIQLEADMAKAQAEQKDAEAEVKKLEAKKKQGIRVDDYEFDAARLKVEAAQIRQSGIIMQQVGLDKQSEVNKVLDSQERQALNMRETTSINQAELNLAKNRRYRSDQKRDIDRIRRRVARQLRVTADSGEGLNTDKIRLLGKNYQAANVDLPTVTPSVAPNNKELEDRLNRRSNIELAGVTSSTNPMDQLMKLQEALDKKYEAKLEELRRNPSVQNYLSGTVTAEDFKILQGNLNQARRDQREAEIELRRLENKRSKGFDVSDAEIQATKLKLETSEGDQRTLVQALSGNLTPAMVTKSEDGLKNITAKQTIQVGAAKYDRFTKNIDGGTEKDLEQLGRVIESQDRRAYNSNNPSELLRLVVDRLGYINVNTNSIDMRVGSIFDSIFSREKQAEKSSNTEKQKNTLDTEKLGSRVKEDSGRLKLSGSLPNLVTGNASSTQDRVAQDAIAPSVGSVNQTFNVYFNQADQQSADQFVQTVRKELKDTLLLVALDAPTP
jgi:hypothetical protein